MTEDIPALIEQLDGNQMDHRIAIFDLADAGDKAVPYLIEGLHDANIRIRTGVIAALHEIGYCELAVEPLVSCLSDKESCIREQVARTLGE